MTLDEQIKRQEAVIRHCDGKAGQYIEADIAILVSLRRLKEIEAGGASADTVPKMLPSRECACVFDENMEKVLSACAAHDAWKRDADTVTVPEEVSWPTPEHAQHIQFEGCDCVVMSPEEYEELYRYSERLGRDLAAAKEELALLKNPTLPMLKALCGEPLLLAASQEHIARKAYDAMLAAAEGKK